MASNGMVFNMAAHFTVVTVGIQKLLLVDLLLKFYFLQIL